MKQLVLFLICGTLVCSCTVTKRHFGNGYHVEWNRKIKSVHEKEESPELEAPESHVALKSIHESDSVIGNKDAINDQPITALDVESTATPENHPLKHPQAQSRTGIEKVREIKIDESDPEDEPIEVENPILHPLTWGIWGSWTLAFLGILFIAGGFEVLGLIWFPACLFLAMIFAIIMIVSLRKHPEKYRYKGLSYGFAIPAIILGGLALLLTGIVILAGGIGISY